MNNHGHAQTTTAALEALPAWEQAIWAPEKRNLAEVYSLYGDTYALDKKGIGPYVEFPEGDIPDFYMTRFRWKRHYDAAVDYWEFPFHDRALRTLDHFLGRIVGALRAGAIGDAARFAGTMAHYVEDHACPGHALDDTDLEIVKDLLPPPARLRLLPFHSMMEKSPAPFSLDGHAPRLYGTLIPQASANFIDRLAELTRHGRACVLPFFQSFYAGDPATADALNASICRLAAGVLADFLHTATAIAFDRIGEDERRALAVKKLADAQPHRLTAWAPHPYDQLAAGDLRGVNVTPSHEPAPCALLRDRGGRLEAEDVPESLGATPLYEHAFHVPAGVYRKFSTDYGVHATLGANQPIVFEVWCDERLLFQDVRRAGEAAGSATLDWPGDGTQLRLVATVGADAPVKRINGRPVSFAGHAVWGRPRLGCD